MDIQGVYELIMREFKDVTGTDLEVTKFCVSKLHLIALDLAIANNKVKEWEAEAKERVRLTDIELRKSEAITAHLEQKKESFIDDAKHEFMELATQAMDIVSKLEKLLDVVENNEFKQDYVDQLSEITGVTYKPTDINDKPEGTTVDCLDLGALNNLVEPNPVKVDVKEVVEVVKAEHKEVVSADELMKVAKEAKVREELTVLLAELDVMLEEKRLEPSATRKKEIQKEITKLRSRINYRKKKLQ